MATPQVVWHEYMAEDGSRYFYNPVTGEASWTNPNAEAASLSNQVGNSVDSGLVSGNAAEEEYEVGDGSNTVADSAAIFSDGGLQSAEVSAVTDGAVAVDSTQDRDFDSTLHSLENNYGTLSFEEIPQGSQDASPDMNFATPPKQPVEKARSAEEIALESLGWMVYRTDGDDPYYYNLNSGETQWTLPDEISEKEHEILASGDFKASKNPSSPPRRIQSFTAVDNPDIQYDYDRVRLSPPPLDSAAGLLSSVPSRSNFESTTARGHTRGKGTQRRDVSGASAASISPQSSTKMAVNDLDDINLEEYKTADREALNAARDCFSPIILAKIRKRFRAAASQSKGGPNWDKMFAKFDKSGDGKLDASEFFLAVRNGMKIPSRVVSDRDIEILIKALDLNGDGCLDLIEFVAFLTDDDTSHQDNLRLKRSIIGLRPAKAKTAYNMSSLSHGQLLMVGGANPGFDKAKRAQEELELQRRARKMSEQRLKSASRRGWHSAQMASKIINIPSAEKRLKPRVNPRGQRQANKSWTKSAHRLKIAHAAQKIWKDPEMRHAAYTAMLANVDSSMLEIQSTYQYAHKRNSKSRVTPAVLEILRKKLKSQSYTAQGEDYVNLFNIFDNDRRGAIEFPRWLSVVRKSCKITKALLSDEDIFEIFQTIAGQTDGKVNDAIDMNHLLRFIKTDMPAALSLSKENSGRVSQAEVLLYVIKKAKDRLKECALNAQVLDWDTMFTLYDTDGNGALSYDEFSRIFRTDLRLSTKELSESELRLIFDFIDDDMSGEISAQEFAMFLHSGESERRFPVCGDDTQHLTASREKRGRMPGAMTAFERTANTSERVTFGAHEFKASIEDAERKDRLKEAKALLKKKARAYSYTFAGQDWTVAFEAFDKSQDNQIDANEFRVGIRKIFKIPPLSLSDKDIKDIFNGISKEGSGVISEVDFTDFIGGSNMDKGHFDQSTGDWQHVDEEEIKRKALKKFKMRVKKMSYHHLGKVDLERVFRRFDRDGSGQVTLQEITDAIRRFLKIPESDLTRHDIKIVFKAIDADGNGTIELSEFLSAIENTALE